MLSLHLVLFVRLVRMSETSRAQLIGFSSVEGAGNCVAEVIAVGIIPAGMEMMDRLAVQAAEAFVKVGYPLDVAALLIVELDGVGAECDHLIDEVTRIAEANGPTTLSASRAEGARDRKSSE